MQHQHMLQQFAEDTNSKGAKRSQNVPAHTIASGCWLSWITFNMIYCYCFQ